MCGGIGGLWSKRESNNGYVDSMRVNECSLKIASVLLIGTVICTWYMGNVIETKLEPVR